MSQIVVPLPNGRQQFLDGGGTPLAAGNVGTYIPGTLTPKVTYQDSLGNVPNLNPITLDGIGSAVIWGNGYYRQIVKDNTGTVLWDTVTLCNVPTPQNTTNVISTSDVTIPGSDFWSNAVLRGPSGTFTDTTDTAVNIINASPYPVVFYIQSLKLINVTGQTWMINQGTGVTFQGNFTGSVPAGESLDVLIQIAALGSNPSVFIVG